MCFQIAKKTASHVGMAMGPVHLIVSTQNMSVTNSVTVKIVKMKKTVTMTRLRLNQSQVGLFSF